jgi:chlorobactene glucosyltransferase
MSDSLLTWLWPALALPITMVWLSRHAAINEAKRLAGSLIATSDTSTAHATPSVSVIVAAKDEEAGIEQCVRSLLAQDYPDIEFIFIDDRSNDRTGQILDALAAEANGKLRVLHITDLPSGWRGKSHAVHQGVAVATGQYLLFTDADCDFESTDAVTHAVRYAIDQKIDFLSILPVVVPSCMTEAIVHPVCSAVLMIWNKMDRVNDPQHSAAYANGAFMLMTRETYDRIGGHEGVRAELVEDMQLARNTKAIGARLFVAQNDGLYTTRMYDSPSATWRGWSRIFQGGIGTPRRIVAAIVILFLFSLLPWISAATAAVVLLLSDASAYWKWVFAAWSAAAIAQQSVTLRLYPLMHAPPARALTYVAGAFVTGGILVDALLKSLGVGATTWGDLQGSKDGDHAN